MVSPLPPTTSTIMHMHSISSHSNYPVILEKEYLKGGQDTVEEGAKRTKGLGEQQRQEVNGQPQWSKRGWN